MLLDHFTFRVLVAEVATAIRDDRITTAGLSGPYRLLLTGKRNRTLVINAAPEFQRFFIASPGKPIPSTTPYLNNRLSGALVKKVEADPCDRVARISLVSINPLGQETIYHLIIELTGRNSNLILVDAASGRILDALRRVTAEMSRVRRIVPGALYIPPPLPNRLLPTVETPVAAFVERMTEMHPLPLADRLLRVLPGMTPTTSREIIQMADGEAGATMIDTTIYERLWSVALDLYKNFSPDYARGFLILDEGGHPSGITVLGATGIPDGQKILLSSISTGLEYLDEGKPATRSSSLRHTVVRRLRSVEKKLNMLEHDLEEAKEADCLQKKGHILMANLQRVPRWVSTIDLLDFYSEDGSTLTLDLDPTLSPVENARRYLVRAKKAKTRESVITSWIESTRQEFDYLSDLVERLSNREGQFSEEQLQDLESRYILPGGVRHCEVSTSTHPRRYITSDGWKVIVGRSNEENDRLTREVADREDIWLHAQGCPGAHVVLQREGHKDEPPRRTLEEAASLAAYWSKARGARTVPVIYTRVKYVRKPKGAKAGVVTVTHEKTIFVEPGLLPMYTR